MTKDEIIDLADKCFIDSKNQIDFIERFAILVAENEREACAKIADNWDERNKLSNYGRCIGLVIRKRGLP